MHIFPENVHLFEKEAYLCSRLCRMAWYIYSH